MWQIQTLFIKHLKIKVFIKYLKIKVFMNNLTKTFELPAFFSLNYTAKFKRNFLKKGSKGISKNLHFRSRHSLLSESVKTSGVSLCQTYFIAEVNGACFLKSEFSVFFCSNYKSFLWILFGIILHSQLNCYT